MYLRDESDSGFSVVYIPIAHCPLSYRHPKHKTRVTVLHLAIYKVLPALSRNTPYVTPCHSRARPSEKPGSTVTNT